MKLARIAAALAMASVSTTAAAPPENDPMLEIAQAWDHARYTVNEEDDRGAELHQLGDVIDKQIAVHANDPNLLIWRAIILAGEADAIDGPTALPLAWRAKHLLEQAGTLNPDSASACAMHTTLGMLYARVPGFPLAFGDRHLAETHLRRGLAIEPNGIEANFFYGVFLIDERRFRAALPFLHKVLDWHPRPERTVGDAGMGRAAAALLTDAEQQLFSR